MRHSKSHTAVPIEPLVEEYCTKAVYDADGVQVSASIGKDGKEYGDPVPLAPPVGYTDPPDIMTMIRSMIQSEKLKEELQKEGFETFEESDDFDIEDDPLEPMTVYEKHFLPPERAPEKAAGALNEPGATSGTPASVAQNPTNTGKTEAGVSSPPPDKTASQPAPGPVPT